jgi:hypothetical protein
MLAFNAGAGGGTLYALNKIIFALSALASCTPYNDAFRDALEKSVAISIVFMSFIFNQKYIIHFYILLIKVIITLDFYHTFQC